MSYVIFSLPLVMFSQIVVTAYTAGAQKSRKPQEFVHSSLDPFVLYVLFCKLHEPLPLTFLKHRKQPKQASSLLPCSCAFAARTPRNRGSELRRVEQETGTFSNPELALVHINAQLWAKDMLWHFQTSRWFMMVLDLS